MLSYLRLAVRLLREPRVPWLTKAVPILAALYMLSPIDLLPDTIPFVGELDDVTLLVASVALFVRLCPRAAVGFHQTAVAQGRGYSPMRTNGDRKDEVIDVEFRRE